MIRALAKPEIGIALALVLTGPGATLLALGHPLAGKVLCGLAGAIFVTTVAVTLVALRRLDARSPAKDDRGAPP